MKILIVEDEALVARSLEFLLKLDDHRITGIAGDIAAAVASVDREKPDLALVDMRLARGSSGYDVAVALHGRGVLCFFLTGNVPVDACPEVALGCIEKPYSEAVLQAALKFAEVRLAGGGQVESVPHELILY
jgi:DNA-binding response OmpR family regulator